MSPEFVVQCMYAADPFGVIGGEVALAGNNELVAQVLPQTAGISMESVLSPFQNIPLESPLETILAKKSISLSSQVLYGSSRLGTMNYLSGQYGMSYHRVSYSERVYDTIGLHGHRPYYSFAGNQLATGGVGSYGQPFWMNQSHSGQHLIGHTSTKLSIRTLAKLSTSLGNVQVTVSDLPYRKSIDGGNLYQAALKSVYTSTKLSTSDYYPFGSLMPGRTVMDTTVHCVDMTQIDRVWQPAYENGLPFNSLFSEMSPWGAASYELSSDHGQLDLFIEDEQSGIKLLLDSGIGSGSLVLEGKVSNITDRGIVLRVQGVDAEGNGVVYHQEHLGQFDGKMEIPLDSAYSDYVVNIQGLLQWSILGNTVVNGHWVETEVLVRVCDEVGDKYRFGFNGMEKDNEMKGLGNSLDFGARMYDSRVGRWLSVDPLAAKAPHWTPYRFGFNNPLVFIDRNGEFELDEKTQSKYKMFSLYIKEYMKNDVLNSDIIMKSMYEITNHNLTKEEMEKVLEWNKGPKIVIDDDKSLNEYGYYNKSTNTIHLNKTNIDRLENALINDKSSDDTKLGALLGTYMTLLHELGHYGEELTHSTGDMHNRDIGYIIERAIWTGEAHTTKEGLYISKKERAWFFGNTYNLKDNKEIIDRMKQTPEDEKTLPTVPKMKENE